MLLWRARYPWSAQETGARISYDLQGEQLVLRVAPNADGTDVLFRVGDKMKGQALKRAAMTRVSLPSLTAAWQLALELYQHSNLHPHQACHSLSFYALVQPCNTDITCMHFETERRLV